MNGTVSRDELEAIVSEFRHVLEEHRRAHVESAARRRFERRLQELDDELERLLLEWVRDEPTRRAWREHLHHDAPEPDEPVARRRLVFRGRSDAGSVVEVREGNGDYDVLIDGCLAGRLAPGRGIGGRRVPHTLVFEDLDFREIFAAPAPAREALRAFVAGEERRPPWRYAAELASDGLVDRHFALTPRGSRALAPPERRVVERRVVER